MRRDNWHPHLHRQGYPVNEKRVRRLLRIMGLKAVYQKPDTRHFVKRGRGDAQQPGVEYR